MSEPGVSFPPLLLDCIPVPQVAVTLTLTLPIPPCFPQPEAAFEALLLRPLSSLCAAFSAPASPFSAPASPFGAKAKWGNLLAQTVGGGARPPPLPRASPVPPQGIIVLLDGISEAGMPEGGEEEAVEGVHILMAHPLMALLKQMMPRLLRWARKLLGSCLLGGGGHAAYLPPLSASSPSNVHLMLTLPTGFVGFYPIEGMRGFATLLPCLPPASRSNVRLVLTLPTGAKDRTLLQCIHSAWLPLEVCGAASTLARKVQSGVLTSCCCGNRNRNLFVPATAPGPGKFRPGLVGVADAVRRHLPV